MFQKIRQIANNPKWIEMLFYCLILTFPFGSHLLSFSLSFMTIYPHLIVLLVLSGLCFFAKSKVNSTIEKYFLLLMLAILLFSLVYLPFVSGKKNAIIDIRSIALMLMTSYVLVSVSKIIGYEKWRSILSFSLKLIFALVVLFSIFEMLTKIHFVGAFTHDVSIRGLDDFLLRTPVFLWDNPNNLVAYLILIGLAILLLEKPSVSKKILTGLILTTVFFISFICQARLGILVSISIASVFFLYLLWEFISTAALSKKRIVVVCSSGLVLGILIVLFSKEKFYKIPDHQLRHSNEAVLVYSVVKDSITNAEYVVKNDRDSVLLSERDTTKEKVVHSRNNTNSENERLALLKNGIDFLVQSKFMGVGPGQYRELHETNKIKNFAHGNNSAHFWLLELFSQYGIFIFLGYVILLLWIFIASLKAIKTNLESTTYFAMALIGFVGASCLPSGFLILDINWIFVAVLVVVAANLQKINPSAND